MAGIAENFDHSEGM